MMRLQKSYHSLVGTSLQQAASLHFNQDCTEPQQRPQEGNNELWYPPSVGSSQSPGSSRPGTPSSSSSGNFGVQRPADRPSSVSQVSPAEAAGIITAIKDKCLEELRQFLDDKDRYQNLLLSLDPVKTQNKVRDDLRNETLQLAGENLEKEPRIMELRNQCRISAPLNWLLLKKSCMNWKGEKKSS